MSQDNHQPPRLIFRPTPKTVSQAQSKAREEERLRAAREKAAEYRNPKPPIPNDEDKVHAIEEWADLVTKRIDEAMRRGDFDRLSGHGKPMRVDKDPFVPEDQQMAFSLLKNNDMVPTWIADRKEMLRSMEQWREEFGRIVSEAHSAWVAAGSDERRVQVRQRWERWLTRWEDEIAEINRRIAILNLKQPVTQLEVYKLRLDDELRKVGMGRTLEK
jgi:hypothetical protein